MSPVLAVDLGVLAEDDLDEQIADPVPVEEVRV